MHRLWSDGHWNELTIAHGCYWKKCSFCDVSLDCISRYETATAELLVDRMEAEAVVAETGQTGFHFVTKRHRPRCSGPWLRNCCVGRSPLPGGATSVSRSPSLRNWHSSSPNLDASPFSGGLEVAPDRLLKMTKGVSVAQAARVARGFTDAGILVHAHLMYGFPTQTVQDTVDALDYVRQLFEADCIQSGFFHRFTATVQSPVGQNPQEYGITLLPSPEGAFAKNDVGFHDPTGTDHDAMGAALEKALYN
ncbi:hypothetical protein [Streptomyces flavofungini]|uniref:hypothetical protein n=1 Tax=Streptomyces flavofungini TaxID=68200 RepID=UPI0025B16B73|nr:hypothetical protein [Streptomyces flavofungini]WJV50544.1 hypothetical protein QUY26_36595 [Streptomyces flavofungini]